MNKTDMKTRIKDARERKGLTQQGLADLLGITQQTVAAWESAGSTPRTPKLIEMAQILSVPVEWLQFGGNVSKAARPVVTFEDTDPLPDDEVEVPQYSIALSAGTGKLVWEIDNVGKPNRFRKDWCRKRGVNPSKLVTFPVQGDSMEPTIPDGACVTIDSGSTTVRNGKVHAIDYMGEFFIKRLFKRPDGSVLIQSDNTDKIRHPDWEVTPDTPDALSIMGVVISMQTDIF